jgi:hypothetical protein
VSWQRALSEIAQVARELVAVRDAGFTERALKFPRDEFALELLCAFNGASPSNAPRGWRYFPNEGTAKAWGRVADAARARGAS